MTVDAAIRDFVQTQKKWLDLELQAEVDEAGSSGDKGGDKVNGQIDGEGGRAQRTLRNLGVEDVSVGLYGRTVVTLSLATDTTNAAAERSCGLWVSGSNSSFLPAHRLTVGDEVEIISGVSRPLSTEKNKAGARRGVVSALTDTTISIALSSKNNGSYNVLSPSDGTEYDHVAGTPPLTVVPLISADVHRKMTSALNELDKFGVDHPVAGPVIRAIFHPLLEAHSTTISGGDNKPFGTLKPFNPNLNNSQLEAIDFALNNHSSSGHDRPIALIHGPPGTGKTTAIAELILQAVCVYKWRILVTAPSNVAVDNVLERLIISYEAYADDFASKTISTDRKKRSKKINKPRLNAVRIGHLARIKPALLPYSLESLVQNASGTEIVSDIRSELQTHLSTISTSNVPREKRSTAFREIKLLRNEIRRREEKVVHSLICNADVVLATNVGAASFVLNKVVDCSDAAFDLVVIDEAAQALEAACWIPILKGKRAVLAGDHCQLPPTIKSQRAEVINGLGRTMFERVIELGKDGEDRSCNMSRMLKVQYRMHEDIANWSSQAMYNGDVKSCDAVRKRTLIGLPHVAELVTQEFAKFRSIKAESAEHLDSVANAALLLIDTTGCDMHESTDAAGSRYNKGEADIVVRHVRLLLDIGMKPEEIAVITPYNGQVELLRSMLLTDIPKLEIRSVDGFQGGEREAVVLSLVRSSDRGGIDGIGFLRDKRRLNVAVTRAKRHCAVVCDCGTVRQDEFLRGLVTWIEGKGECWSAIQFLMHNTDDGRGAVFASTNNRMVAEMPSAQQQITNPFALSANAELERKELSKDKKHASPCERNQGQTETRIGRLIFEETKAKQRRAFMDRMDHFCETAKESEELHLGQDLSSFDRLIVHELAEQLGLGHRSEGVVGVDRRTIITKLTEHRLPPTQVDGQGHEVEPRFDTVSLPTVFSALAFEEDPPGSDNDENGNTFGRCKELATVGIEEYKPDANPMLAELAKERMARQYKSHKPLGSNLPQASSKETINTKRAQKQGQRVAETNSVAGDLDDMDFLNAEILKVQNSHNRKIEAGGNNYKSIVNGILLAKPKKQQKEKDQKAKNALDAKLKQAQNDRMASRSGKKKK